MSIEAKHFSTLDGFRGLESNNNCMITKKDRLTDDQEVEPHVAIDEDANFRTKMNSLNNRSKKMFMWRFMIFLDHVDDPPEWLTDPNAVHYLHIKYYNRRTIFKIDSSMTKEMI